MCVCVCVRACVCVCVRACERLCVCVCVSVLCVFKFKEACVKPAAVRCGGQHDDYDMVDMVTQ